MHYEMLAEMACAAVLPGSLRCSRRLAHTICISCRWGLHRRYDISHIAAKPDALIQVVVDCEGLLHCQQLLQSVWMAWAPSHCLSCVSLLHTLCFMSCIKSMQGWRVAIRNIIGKTTSDTHQNVCRGMPQHWASLFARESLCFCRLLARRMRMALE